jgi:SMC interacting uncharacterized protein involved in chromosome segregation
MAEFKSDLERIDELTAALAASERHRGINLREAVMWQEAYDELETEWNTKRVEMQARISHLERTLQAVLDGRS